MSKIFYSDSWTTSPIVFYFAIPDSFLAFKEKLVLLLALKQQDVALFLFQQAKTCPSLPWSWTNKDLSTSCFSHLARILIHQMHSPSEVPHCFIKTQKQSNRDQHLSTWGNVFCASSSSSFLHSSLKWEIRVIRCKWKLMFFTDIFFILGRLSTSLCRIGIPSR